MRGDDVTPDDVKVRDVQVGDVLPTVPLTAGGRTLAWRDTDRTSLVVVPHPAACRGCARLLGDLRGIDGQLEDWGARVLIVADRAGGDGGDPIVQVADPDAAARRALGLTPEMAAVAVLDRFGQVFGRWVERGVASVHGLPEMAELLEEVRFVAVQCPECEVPDVPPVDRLPES